MTKKSQTSKDASEKVIKNTRQKTRQKYQQKRRSALFWTVFVVGNASLCFVALRVSLRVFIIDGRMNSPRQANRDYRATRRAKPLRLR